MNLREVLEARLELKKAIRLFFENLKYLEVDTPQAVIMPGTEVYLDYFETSWVDHKRNKHPLWLRSSPEIHMKKILANDCDRIFQIARCYRNTGELSDWHHPEFDLLEWYQKNITFENFIEQTSSLLRTTLEIMRTRLPGKVPFHLPPIIEKMTVKEAFYEIAHIDLVDGDIELAQKAREKGVISVGKQDDFETAYFKTLLEKIEPRFAEMGTVALYDYPPSQAALAKIENGVAKRFEFYVNGVELCNAFLEELDPSVNEKRIIETNKKRRILGRKIPLIDREFLKALSSKSYSTCGNALGFDRWLAIILGQENLDYVIPFKKEKPYGF